MRSPFIGQKWLHLGNFIWSVVQSHTSVMFPRREQTPEGLDLLYL